jgi:hypothetical protein
MRGAAPRPVPNINGYLTLRSTLPCVFKGLDRADEIAARDTGVAFLNVLLRGCNLLRIYICNDGLIDGDLRQFERAICCDPLSRVLKRAFSMGRPRAGVARTGLP